MLVHTALDEIIHIPGTDNCHLAATLLIDKRNPHLEIAHIILCQSLIGKGIIAFAPAQPLNRQLLEEVCPATF